jgi:hypothetical protein
MDRHEKTNLNTQEEEIESLESIYGSDFRRGKEKRLGKTTFVISFSSQTGKQSVSCLIEFIMPPKYPSRCRIQIKFLQHAGMKPGTQNDDLRNTGT